MNEEPQLFRVDYPVVDGMRYRTESTDLFVWAVVDTKTGEVDMTDLAVWEEWRYTLNPGYEWRRFRLVPE